MRSNDFEKQGLTDPRVELEHLRTVVQEIKRERAVTESVQKDNAMLREQLRRSEEVRGVQEKENTVLSSENSVLRTENTALRAENASLVNDKEKLQQELLAATDFITAIENKCYQANKTSLELLNTLRETELEVETLKTYIIDLKSRIAIYIPVKDDPIDI